MHQHNNLIQVSFRSWSEHFRRFERLRDQPYYLDEPVKPVELVHLVIQYPPSPYVQCCGSSDSVREAARMRTGFAEDQEPVGDPCAQSGGFSPDNPAAARRAESWRGLALRTRLNQKTGAGKCLAKSRQRGTFNGSAGAPGPPTKVLLLNW